MPKDNDEDEEDIYEDKSREGMLEDDDITAEDEGFMKGYEQEKSMAECARCHKILVRDFIEMEVGDETLRFCSEKCAEKYKPK